MTTTTDISINLPSSEMLTEDELCEVTGAKTSKLQCEWLDNNNWAYTKNRAGRPVVGRFYARCRLSGITPGKIRKEAVRWEADFSAIQ